MKIVVCRFPRHDIIFSERESLVPAYWLFHLYRSQASSQCCRRRVNSKFISPSPLTLKLFLIHLNNCNDWTSAKKCHKHSSMICMGLIKMQIRWSLWKMKGKGFDILTARSWMATADVSQICCHISWGQISKPKRQKGTTYWSLNFVPSVIRGNQHILNKAMVIGNWPMVVSLWWPTFNKPVLFFFLLALNFL